MRLDLHDVVEKLKSNQEIGQEAEILKKLHFKFKNQWRREKVLKSIKRVSTLWERFKTLNLKGLLSELEDLLPNRSGGNSEIYLPSYLLVSYDLSIILRACVVLKDISLACAIGCGYIQQQISAYLFVHYMTLSFAALSKFSSLCQAMMNMLSDCYNSIFRLLALLEKPCEAELLKDLPKSARIWLKSELPILSVQPSASTSSTALPDFEIHSGSKMEPEAPLHKQPNSGTVPPSSLTLDRTPSPMEPSSEKMEETHMSLQHTPVVLQYVLPQSTPVAVSPMSDTLIHSNSVNSPISTSPTTSANLSATPSTVMESLIDVENIEKMKKNKNRNGVKKKVKNDKSPSVKVGFVETHMPLQHIPVALQHASAALQHTHTPLQHASVTLHHTPELQQCIPVTVSPMSAPSIYANSVSAALLTTKENLLPAPFAATESLVEVETIKKTKKKKNKHGIKSELSEESSTMKKNFVAFTVSDCQRFLNGVDRCSTIGQLQSLLKDIKKSKSDQLKGLKVCQAKLNSFREKFDNVSKMKNLKNSKDGKSKSNKPKNERANVNSSPQNQEKILLKKSKRAIFRLVAENYTTDH